MLHLPNLICDTFLNEEVYVYIYILIYIYIYIYILIYISIHIYKYIYTYTYKYTDTYIYIFAATKQFIECIGSGGNLRFLHICEENLCYLLLLIYLFHNVFV